MSNWNDAIEEAAKIVDGEAEIASQRAQRAAAAGSPEICESEHWTKMALQTAANMIRARKRDVIRTKEGGPAYCGDCAKLRSSDCPFDWPPNHEACRSDFEEEDE